MKQQIISWKKQLNTLAELGWQEKKTTRYIELSMLPNKPVIKGFGKEKTGLLYKIGKGTSGILLRADIDGLKTTDGVKHICGHSSHIAGLMGALLEGKGLEKELTAKNKCIYFLFQPCEENFPSGAQAFLQAFPIKNVSFGFSSHVKPLLPLGTIGLYPGAIWARGDYMEIEIHGKMVHVKDATDGRDALAAASEIILFVRKLQKQYEKNMRIIIGTTQGGLQANTVADYAKLTGDIRLRDDTQQKFIKDILIKEIRKIEKRYKVKIDFTYFDGYPVVKNDPKLTQTISKVFQQKKEWKIIANQSLFSYGCEDFAYISEKIRSVYAFIGTGDTHDIHQKDCEISDEGTIRVYNYFSEIIQWWNE